MLIIKKTNNNKEKEEFINCWWECKPGQLLCKSAKIKLKPKTKNWTTYDSTVPLLRMFLEDSKSAHCRDTCVFIFIAAVFTIARSGCSLDIHQQQMNG